MTRFMNNETIIQSQFSTNDEQRLLPTDLKQLDNDITQETLTGGLHTNYLKTLQFACLL